MGGRRGLATGTVARSTLTGEPTTTGYCPRERAS
jgi:hypothetical protein